MCGSYKCMGESGLTSCFLRSLLPLLWHWTWFCYRSRLWHSLSKCRGRRTRDISRKIQGYSSDLCSLFIVYLRCFFIYSQVFPGEDGESSHAGGVSVFDVALHKDEGSNLMDPKPSVAIRAPTLLDLPRRAVNRDLFESFTSTGALYRNIPASCCCPSI